MKKSHVLMLLIALGMPAALASGTLGTPKNDSRQAFEAVKTMKCRVVAIKEPNLIMLEDPQTGTKTPARLANRVWIRPRDKRMFGGRKTLTFADLKPGQTVKVSMDMTTCAMAAS